MDRYPNQRCAEEAIIIYAPTEVGQNTYIEFHHL